MKTLYTSRRYRDGDASAINDLYKQITGRGRTLSEFSWQWLQAPGGVGDIWLIEAEYPSGRCELVGHHGIMPIRFTFGDLDLLFGKTENTMVLPEHRDKIIYPRFEKKFAREYEPRFDALFSTMGPAAAIRQRAAQGYVSSHQWVQRQRFCLLGLLMVPMYKLGWLKLDAKAPSLYLKRTTRKTTCCWRHLSNVEAISEPFFTLYWNQARICTGIAPRRDKLDLAWRFWNNPYLSVDTFIIDNRDVRGYVIIEMNSPSIATLLDWSFCALYENLKFEALGDFFIFLEDVYHIKRIIGLSTDGPMHSNSSPGLDTAFSSSRPIRYFRKSDNFGYMPRKITESGRDKGLSVDGWDVTPIVFEGRS